MEGHVSEQSEQRHDEYSAMAWEVAVRGKNGREIGVLHERWATAFLSRDAFDKAQHHLDQALEAWIAYDEPILAARTWCLKGSCSGAAGDFTVAASSFKRAQQLAEEAGDAQLVLCVMLNRAICEVRIGDPTAAAACSRRAFVKAEAEHDPAMILVAHCVRATSYQMAGNFLAACNEHESAEKLVADGGVSPPDPALALAMDTNFGISFLRSGKPCRATAPFDRALATARNALGGEPPLALARCMFHAGEARRQAGELAGARTLLEEVALIVDREGVAVLGVDTSERAKWSALAMEVANSRGLCAIAEGAQRFNGERKSLTEDEPDKVRLNADLPPATASVAGDSGSSTDRASATSESEESGVQMVGVGGAGDGDVPRRASRGRIRRADTTAEKAAMIIAAGGKAGGLGAHPVQKTYNAVLEGLLWSIAGRGDTDGALAVKRAEKGLEMLERRRRPSTLKEPATANRFSSSGPASETLGQSSFAGNESDGEMCTLQLGVLASQGMMERGGLGLGAGCCTSILAREETLKTGKATKTATGALAAVAAARAAAKASAAGWAEAGQLAKKQQAYAAQATTESARQLSVAHAHAGAISLMTGDLAEAEGRFECQLEEAQKAGDAVLEALAERNLADAREADDDLPGSLRHLRRCWNLAQTGRNTALEVDTCRRLCTVYSEIAAASPGLEGAIKSKGSDGREEGSGGKGGEDDTDTTGLTEPEIEEREDNDLAYLRATAAERALLFAERYEAGVSGLEWPVSGDIAGGGSESGGSGSDLADGLTTAELSEAADVRH